MKYLKFILLGFLVVLALVVLYGNSRFRPVREVFTFTTIDAPKEQVWQVLTNFSAYRQWNPFLTEIDGKCVEGARLRVQVQLPDRVWTYAPNVRTLKPQQEMAWSKQLILPGLLDGEHRFQVEDTDAGKTRFVQHDRYSGALVPLVMGLYQAEAESGFRRMSDALKKRAEHEYSMSAER